MAGNFSDLLAQFAPYSGGAPKVNATLELTFGSGTTVDGWPNDRNDNESLAFKALWEEKFAHEGIRQAGDAFPLHLPWNSKSTVNIEVTYPLGTFQVPFTSGAGQNRGILPLFTLVSPLTITVSSSEWVVNYGAEQDALNTLSEGATGSDGALSWKVTDLGVVAQNGIVYLDETKSEVEGIDPQLAGQIATATLKMDLHACRDFGSIISEYGHPTPREITIAALDTVPATDLKRNLERLLYKAVVDELDGVFEGIAADWKATGLVAKNVYAFKETVHSTLSPQGASDEWHSTSMSFACTVTFNAASLPALGLDPQSTSGALPTKIEAWDPKRVEFSLADITLSSMGGNQ